MFSNVSSQFVLHATHKVTEKKMRPKFDNKGQK